MTRKRRESRRTGEVFVDSSGTLPRPDISIEDGFDDAGALARPFEFSDLAPQAVVRAPWRRLSYPARQVVRKRQRVPMALQIGFPQQVRFCVARRERREVLFATGRAGFGGSAPRKHYRRTQNSQYRC